MAYGGASDDAHVLLAVPGAFIGSLFYYADKARWVTDTIISDELRQHPLATTTAATAGTRTG